MHAYSVNLFMHLYHPLPLHPVGAWHMAHKHMYSNSEISNLNCADNVVLSMKCRQCHVCDGFFWYMWYISTVRFLLICVMYVLCM